MTRKFRYFVIFAEMRTGSNFLEANLNDAPGLQCLGETFNKSFVGYPDTQECLGMSLLDRNIDPFKLLDLISKGGKDLYGFRYFHDHDDRILDTVLEDPSCGKILLSRSLLDSYISLKIARLTGQWKLTNSNGRVNKRVPFDTEEFEEHCLRIGNFRNYVVKSLQRTGQVPFHLDYEDLVELNTLNGLIGFLGLSARLQSLNQLIVKQNSSHLKRKVVNVGEMKKALKDRLFRELDL